MLMYSIKTMCPIFLKVKLWLFTRRSSINNFYPTVYKTFQQPTKLIFSKCKKQLITTLRAPKHFKVGRHHLHTHRRLIIITTSLHNTFISSNLSSTSVKSFSYRITQTIPQHPVSQVSSVSTVFKVSINLNFGVSVI